MFLLPTTDKKNNSSRWLKKIRPSKGQHRNKLPQLPCISRRKKKKTQPKMKQRA